MEPIKILKTSLKSIVERERNPFVFFIKFYQLVEADFRRIATSYNNDPYSRHRFSALCEFFYIRLKYIIGDTVEQGVLDEINEIIDEEYDNNLLCLSLFKAAADYLVVDKKGILKKLRPQYIDGFIVMDAPPNPIHDSLQKPIRKEEDYGINLRGFIKETFKSISIIKESDLKQSGIEVSLIKNKMVEQTCRHFRNRSGNEVRIAVTPFWDSLKFRFGSQIDDWPGDSRTPYWFEKIENFNEAKKWLINKILIPCQDKKVDILILPELSVDKELLEYLKKWLKRNNRKQVSSGNGGLLMIVAGSFHLKNKDGKRFNTSTVINHGGDVLWNQDKLEIFSLNDQDIEDKPVLAKLLNISVKGGYEGITCSNTVSIVDTPIGRLVVSICIDFFYNLEAYRATGANIFLVPAMTPQTIRFVKAAEFLAERNLAASFVANSAFAAKKDKAAIHKNGRSFYVLPEAGTKCTTAAELNGELLIYEFDVLTKG